MAGEKCKFVKLNSLSKQTVGEFLLHLGKNIYFFTWGMGPNFGPKFAIKKGLYSKRHFSPTYLHYPN